MYSSEWRRLFAFITNVCLTLSTNRKHAFFTSSNCAVSVTVTFDSTSCACCQFLIRCLWIWECLEPVLLVTRACRNSCDRAGIREEEKDRKISLVGYHQHLNRGCALGTIALKGQKHALSTHKLVEYWILISDEMLICELKLRICVNLPSEIVNFDADYIQSNCQIGKFSIGHTFEVFLSLLF